MQNCLLINGLLMDIVLLSGFVYNIEMMTCSMLLILRHYCESHPSFFILRRTDGIHQDHHNFNPKHAYTLRQQHYAYWALGESTQEAGEDPNPSEILPFKAIKRQQFSDTRRRRISRRISKFRLSKRPSSLPRTSPLPPRSETQTLQPYFTKRVIKII